MRIKQKIALTVLLVFLISFAFMLSIRVGSDDIGLVIANEWCSVRGEVNTTSNACLNQINSLNSVIHQTISLSLFLFVIALTVINMEWRTGAAMLALTPLVVLGVVPPQYLLNAVSWDLILFLVGSMTLAGILRELGVFRYVALRVLELSKGDAVTLLLLISLTAFVLSASLGEVTSIIYVVTLIIEIYKITKTDPALLIILSVLATNTGSVALPIGNPIGIYLLFETKMSMTRFVEYAFPLAVIDFVVMFAVLSFIERSVIMDIKKKIAESRHKIESYITTRRIELSSDHVADDRVKRMVSGLVILVIFILMVALNDAVTYVLSSMFKVSIDPHAFLSFIPYVFIVISLIMVVPLEEVSRFIEKSVEWSSLLFFIFLFMFGYSLTYAGVMAKLAYAFTRLGTSTTILMPLMLFSSAFLSSILDNLSVIVTFTPIAMIFSSIGLTSDLIYFALLYGGVFGGNYTPVGSTANILAISLAEKRRIKITWGKWLKISIITTTIQLIASLVWMLASTHVL